MKLEKTHSAEEKRRWKIIRRDTFADVDCDEIIAADEDSGECEVKIKGEIQKLTFLAGIRIVGKAR